MRLSSPGRLPGDAEGFICVTFLEGVGQLEWLGGSVAGEVGSSFLIPACCAETGVELVPDVFCSVLLARPANAGNR